LKSRRWVATIVVATALTFPLIADDSPWGFTRAAVPEKSLDSTSSIATQVFDLLLQSYRENKDRTSIHRCLFDVSCSHFAGIAYSKYGFVAGSVVFIDRYFYRENNGARGLYPLKGDENGIFHLDDGPFVP